MEVQPILVAGEWRKATATATFVAENPATGKVLDATFPVSGWEDCDAALTAAAGAAKELRGVPAERLAEFLELYAGEIEKHAEALVAIAHVETGLPVTPRLRDVELPRTTTQLRQGAAAAREGSWTKAVIDTKNNIRSHYAPIGPVVIFGPNNFPFAFNGISGGDLAAAVAAGNTVIAKGHPFHPGTTKLLAECAFTALKQTGLPSGTIQMLYNISKEDGLRLVSDERVGAISFTGSRLGGLSLKEAADKAGKPIYLEMSSLNPVVILPGAFRERGEGLAVELADSCLAAAGQFCTSPNLIFVIGEEDADRLATGLVAILEERTPGYLLSGSGLKSLDDSVHALIAAGAKVATGASKLDREGYRYKNTLLRVSAEKFLNATHELQREAFGNSTMLVTMKDVGQLCEVIDSLEGNLTGSIYSSRAGEDDAIYPAIAGALRVKVGRLLNDKMPTGVALSAAMNHGGPFPATSHPGFTAVGIPASMTRFAALHCYDNVRQERLPAVLQDKSPNPAMWRLVEGAWVRGD
ncbi:MAG TPA: aldehyde dehydrogenase family protein [Edaphobacter sp.]|nr:aldehyde dehydrogenase family protein [Edaphobacter sp.]